MDKKQPTELAKREPMDISTAQKQSMALAKSIGITEQQLYLVRQGFDPQFQKNTQALALYLAMCHSKNIDPMAFSFYLTNIGGKLTVLAHYTVYQSLAEETGELEHVESVSVYKDEKIDIDLQKGTVSHKAEVSKRIGKPLGAYCVVRRKGFDSVAVWAPWGTYVKAAGKGGVWDGSPEEMIEKSALKKALKKAFPKTFAGVYTQEDFDRNEAGKDEIVLPDDDVTEFMDNAETETAPEDGEKKQGDMFNE